MIKFGLALYFFFWFGLAVMFYASFFGGSYCFDY